MLELCVRPRGGVTLKVDQVGTTVASAQGNRPESAPRWVNGLLLALVIYVAICAVWMLAGFGGERITHYVGLLADSPACFTAVVVAVAAAHRAAPGPSRSAWRCLSVALALYFVGTVIGVNSWLHGRDPFPGPADIFYVAFYPAFFAAIGFLIRAAAVRVRWVQLALDAMILVVGFGAFFWFLVIRPAASSTEIDVIKNALSQSYIALNCMMLLTLGVVLLAGVGNPSGRRVPLLLSGGIRDDVPGRHPLVGGEDQRRLSARRASGRALRRLLRAARRRRTRADAREQRAHRSAALRIPWRSRCRMRPC